MFDPVTGKPVDTSLADYINSYYGPDNPYAEAAVSSPAAAARVEAPTSTTGLDPRIPKSSYPLPEAPTSKPSLNPSEPYDQFHKQWEGYSDEDFNQYYRNVLDVSKRKSLPAGMMNALNYDYWLRNQASNARAAAPTAGPYNGSGYTGGPFGGTTGAGGFEFDDYWGSQFEQAVDRRLQQLEQDPARNQLAAYVQRLLEADRRKQANVESLAGSMRERVAQLKLPPYTDQQEAVIRAKSFDQLERRRQQSLNNRREEIYARGFAPTSGLVVGAEDEVNRNFEQARTGIESDLLHSSIEETERRRDKATQLEMMIEQALSSGDLASMQYLSQVADAEDFQIRDRENRAREILSTYMLPLDLMNQRWSLGNATAGAGSQYSPMASIMALLGFGQQQSQFARQSQANNWMGVGNILDTLFGDPDNQWWKGSDD